MNLSMVELTARNTSLSARCFSIPPYWNFTAYSVRSEKSTFPSILLPSAVLPGQVLELLHVVAAGPAPQPPCFSSGWLM